MKYTFKFRNSPAYGSFRNEDIASIAKSLRGQVLAAFNRCGVCGKGRSAYEHRKWASGLWGSSAHTFKPMVTKKSAAPFYAQVESAAKRIFKQYEAAGEADRVAARREDAARKAANTRRKNVEAARIASGDRKTFGKVTVERTPHGVVIWTDYTSVRFTPATAKSIAAFMGGKASARYAPAPKWRSGL